LAFWFSQAARLQKTENHVEITLQTAPGTGFFPENNARRRRKTPIRTGKALPDSGFTTAGMLWVIFTRNVPAG
jgi:hypothetical protein